MNRRQFLATTAGSLALANFSLAQDSSFRGKIKKAVKFGTTPNEEQMKKLKDLGFDGIGVAMIGRNHPIGIVFAALFFGGLMVGGRIMQFDPGVPFELVRVIEGVIILALAVPELRRQFSRLKGRWGRKE